MREILEIGKEMRELAMEMVQMMTGKGMRATEKM